MNPSNDLLIQRPASSSGPSELLLFFHGVGSSPEDLAPLAAKLAPMFPRAWIVSVRAPDRSDFGQGWQWFSVRDVSEESRPARVAAAMPRFAEAIAAWQGQTGATPAGTTLVGFSQGAIMALESTQMQAPPAHRIVSIAGRFASGPRVAPQDVKLHFLHGEEDRVVPTAFAVDGATKLRALGASISLDLFPGLAHGIDARVVQQLRERLAEVERN